MDIKNSAERGFDQFFAWLPNLVGALVILLVGYVVAKIVGALVRKGLKAVHLDRQLMKGSVGTFVGRVMSSPTKTLGKVAFWLVFLGAISLSVTALGIDALTAFVASLYDYLPHVIAAAIIFLVAAALSGAVAGFVAKVMGDTPTGKVVATAAPILIMTIASFMILTELMIAEEIVLITYAALMGAIALGSALAFGLGGREAAATALSTAVDKGKEQQGQVKRDLDKGRTETKRFAQEQNATDGVGSVTSN
ncbi:MAG: CmpX protein [Thermoleophilia bacterium]|nr:CmpX protein [Thermoleophilia bacterium]